MPLRLNFVQCKEPFVIELAVNAYAIRTPPAEIEKIANVLATVRTAVARAREQDFLIFPFSGDAVDILEQVVEDAGIQDGSLFHHVEKLAAQYPTVLLDCRRIELHFVRVPRKPTTLSMLHDSKAVEGDEGADIAINDAHGYHDFFFQVWLLTHTVLLGV